MITQDMASAAGLIKLHHTILMNCPNLSVIMAAVNT